MLLLILGALFLILRAESAAANPTSVFLNHRDKFLMFNNK